MARLLFEYNPPVRFVAGTVGEPGQRTFYLQATGSTASTSVALEKVQVAALATRVDAILDEVLRQSTGAAVPAIAPIALDDRAPLETPITEDFRVGSLTLAWDADAERLVIEAYADAETAEDAAEADDDEIRANSDLLRVHLTAAGARAFAKRALIVVGAGRPPCPFCNLPLDPAGHVCPRQNGYRRR